MRKKIMALAMTTILAVSSVLTAGATVVTSPSATAVEITAATDADGTEVLHFASEEEAEAYYAENPDAIDEDGGYGYLVVTDSETAPDLEDESVQSLIEDIIDAENLIHEHTGETVEVSDVSVHSLFEVYWVDRGVPENPPYILTFDAPGVTPANFVDVLSLNENTNEWERHEATAGDGHVVVTFTHFCYVAILVSSTESEDTTSDGTALETNAAGDSGSNGNGTSEETGDISLALPIVLLIVAGVAIVVLVAKGKKKEAE